MKLAPKSLAPGRKTPPNPLLQNVLEFPPASAAGKQKWFPGLQLAVGRSAGTLRLVVEQEVGAAGGTVVGECPRGRSVRSGFFPDSRAHFFAPWPGLPFPASVHPGSARAGRGSRGHGESSVSGPLPGTVRRPLASCSKSQRPGHCQSQSYRVKNKRRLLDNRDFYLFGFSP